MRKGQLDDKRQRIKKGLGSGKFASEEKPKNTNVTPKYLLHFNQFNDLV